MSPIYQFKCEVCGKSFDEIVPVGTAEMKCECGHQAKKQITAHGGYSIGGDNGASVRPSHAGGFRKSR